ncbi:50S ribosomal protein L22 [Patescibacteria group bacterium]|nr:50S ribosomal protein L22 [Patescibacteria group bacterium]MBU1915808.1 50S ribosomal protein L22 [Patescibacteria group bacterium]
MEVKAIARNIRMSPRKVRLVADLVRGMDLSEAEAQLTFVRKAAARPVLKLILSAKANAGHNFKLGTDDLYIKTITVDGGPILHRWTPRAFGRATPIRKRTSHITVILSERTVTGATKELSKAVVKKVVAGGAEKKDRAEKSLAVKVEKKPRRARIEKSDSAETVVKQSAVKKGSDKPTTADRSAKSKKASAK